MALACAGVLLAWGIAMACVTPSYADEPESVNQPASVQVAVSDETHAGGQPASPESDGGEGTAEDEALPDEETVEAPVAADAPIASDQNDAADNVAAGQQQEPASTDAASTDAASTTATEDASSQTANTPQSTLDQEQDAPANADKAQGSSTSDKPADKPATEAKPSTTQKPATTQPAAAKQQQESQQPDTSQSEKQKEADQPVTQKEATWHLVDITFEYVASPDAGDEGYTGNPARAYDWRNPPAIAFEKGKMRLIATLVLEDEDGNRREVAASSAKAGVHWRIVQSYDESGAPCSAIARIEAAYAGSSMQDALLTALAQGNGSLTIRCTADAYPEFAGAELTVKVQENDPAAKAAKAITAAESAQAASSASNADAPSTAATARATQQRMLGMAAQKDASDDALGASAESSTIASARLVVYNAARGSYVPFLFTSADGTPAYVYDGGASCSFDIMLTFDDGTQALASEAGVPVTWSLSNSVQNGTTVAAISADGKLNLLGTGSKLVQLQAHIDDATVVGSPAYVQLSSTSAITPPEVGDAIQSAIVNWANTKAQTMGTTTSGATGVANAIAVPTLEGSQVLTLSGLLQLVNQEGSSMVPGYASGIDLVWQIVRFYNTAGDESQTMVTTLGSSGAIAALTTTGAGDGLVIVRLMANGHPEFGGQELLVRVTGTHPTDAATAANTVQNAQLMYYDKDAGTFREYSGFKLVTTPVAIDEPYGSARFDVRLDMQDGSSVRASQVGVGVDWAMAGNLVPRTREALAIMQPDGTLVATNVANGNPRIANAGTSTAGTTALGLPVQGTSAYVRITNNNASIKPRDTLSISATSNYWLAAGQKPDNPDQRWAWNVRSGAAPSGYSVPLLVPGVATSGPAQLDAKVMWSNDVITSEAQDKATRTWSLVSCTDLDGNPCGALVTVSADGAVTATGRGSGFAVVKCVAAVPVYGEDGKQTTVEVEGTFTVAVYNPDKYVTKIELLDEEGNVIPTSSITIPEGQNLYRFSARITTVEFVEGTGVTEKVTIVSAYPMMQDGASYAREFDNLTWGVYRNDTALEPELYSLISDLGQFQALSGFNRAYVQVKVRGGALGGRDISTGVTVFRENKYEYIGTTDSLTVIVYHASDYKLGDAAPVAREITLTRAQLEALANYTTWYTFQRRGDSFSTVYARGVTIENFLLLAGVDPSLLQEMVFVGLDGYAPERHSASYVLGTQLRFHNYYYHAKMPGLVSSETVSPMLALQYYVKDGDYDEAVYDDRSYGNNIGAAGFASMIPDSTFRIIFGMRGIGINNGAVAVSRVSQVVLIVDDEYRTPEEQDEEDPTQQPSDDEGQGGDDGNGGQNDDGDPNDGSDDTGAKDEPGTTDDPGDSSKPSPKPDPDPQPTPGYVNPGKESDTPEENPFQGEDDQGIGKGEGENPNETDATDRRQGDNVAPTVDQDANDQAGHQDATGEQESQQGQALGQEVEATSDPTVVQAVDASGNVVELATMPATAYLREVRESGGVVIPPAELENPWNVPALVLSVFMLLLGGVASRRRYVLDRADGLVLEHASRR